MILRTSLSRTDNDVALFCVICYDLNHNKNNNNAFKEIVREYCDIS